MAEPSSVRGVRVPDKVWSEAQERAAAEGVPISDIVRAGLAAYLESPLRTTSEKRVDKALADLRGALETDIRSRSAST